MVIWASARLGNCIIWAGGGVIGTYPCAFLTTPSAGGGHPATIGGKFICIIQFEIPAFAGMTKEKQRVFLLPLPRPAAPSTPSPAKGTMERTTEK
ncbi:MAG: hypothetical protein LBB23_01025 [Rickettsiales bacterium]|nr:hypothetical protein [Rickettsiales bacterium]